MTRSEVARGFRCWRQSGIRQIEQDGGEQPPGGQPGGHLLDNSQGCNLQEDSQGCNVPEDSHGCNVPEDSHGCNVPEDSHGCNVPEDSHGSVWSMRPGV